MCLGVCVCACACVCVCVCVCVNPSFVCSTQECLCAMDDWSHLYIHCLQGLDLNFVFNLHCVIVRELYLTHTMTSTQQRCSYQRVTNSITGVCYAPSMTCSHDTCQRGPHDLSTCLEYLCLVQPWCSCHLALVVKLLWEEGEGDGVLVMGVSFGGGGGLRRELLHNCKAP